MGRLNDSPEGLAKRLAELEERVASLEETLKSLATKDDIARLEGKVDDMAELLELHIDFSIATTHPDMIDAGASEVLRKVEDKRRRRQLPS